jgi:TonB-linked SusC/RagA family outer membrane protein
MQEITNPVAMLSYLNNTTNTNKFIGNVFAEADLGKVSDFLRGLKLRTSYSLEYSFINGKSYSPEYYLDATHNSPVNGVNGNIDRYHSWNLDNTLTYDKVMEKHHITLMLGQSAYKYNFINVAGSKTQYVFNDLYHAYLDNGQSTTATAGGGYSENTLASLFGRINYDFAGKYLLTAIVRRDGSSRFGSKNKYGTFPSVSLGWVVSEEDFMNNQESLLSFLKLRGGWGKNGNESIGNFSYTSVMTSGSVYYFGSDKTQYNGVIPQKMSNPYIKWEESEQLDLGLDMKLLQNQFSLTLDYYVKTTRKWLVDAPIPDLIGIAAPTINGGDIRNKGIEFDLGYKNDFNKFHFEAKLLGGFNKNEVTYIAAVDNKILGGNGGFGQSNVTRFYVSQAAGSFYGLKTDGLFQNQEEVNSYTHTENGITTLIQSKAVPGDVKFVDQNSDGKIDDADYVNLGNPYPDFTGGFNINMAWKGIDLSMFWYASLGNEIWDATRRYDIVYSNFRSDALNRWIGESTSNSYPRVTLSDVNENWGKPSDFYVKDGSFMRLRNLTLGYTLPSKITQMVKIKKLRFYVSGENLLTFTKYRGFDPEIGGKIFNIGVDYGNYPQARTILGGINISF